MNPRVSRSSALASKATGFPIAKIAAKLALGYTLDEIPNDITRLTPASFEPTIDYVVVKVPRWAFEKFPRADRTLTTQMKSVGEVMAIGRTFKEAFMKAFRSLELGRGSMLFATERRPDQRDRGVDGRRRRRRAAARAGGAERSAHVGGVPRARARLDRRGDPPADADRPLVPDAVPAARRAEASRPALVGLRGISRDLLRTLKRAGLRRLASSAACSAPTRTRSAPRALEQGLRPAYKRIDTCAAEFESFTPYLYGTYEKECEAEPTPRQKVVILGSGPNRIGQGIEFDYCCCHAAFALRDDGFETVMINCNPETVSTDYDTVDRLYFEPLTFEDVSAIIAREQEARRRRRRASCSTAGRRR